MPHLEIRSWTFSGLVGAFLDLAIAYLLLCASSLAYLASKFLGLFGLCLPCPCNGLFGDPNKNCLQGILANCPSEKISSVQCSVRSKFPFDSIWVSDPIYQSNLKLMKEKNIDNGNVELEDETSCSLFSGRGSHDVVGGEQGLRNESGVGCGLISSQCMKEGRFEVKGKGFVTRRSRCGLRRRRKGAIDRGKVSSVSLYDPLPSDSRAILWSPPSVTKMGNESTERSSVPVNSEVGREVSEDIGLQHRVSQGFEMDEPDSENKCPERAASPIKEFKCNSPVDLGVDGNAQSTIRILEQSLEEEHSARAALFLELEKERSAAATAADEAMAMILRLQEEKASIEMEARQYHRMIEEKSSYDAEEMNILKEILVRREKEKHFLEKEVEAYRQMFFRNEQLESHMQDTATTLGQGASSLYSSEDRVVMLQQISESIGERENIKNVNNFVESDITSIGAENHALAFGKELPIPEFNDDAGSLILGEIHKDPLIEKHHQHLPRSNDDTSHEFQGKGLVSVDKNRAHKEREVKLLEEPSKFNQSTQEFSVHEKTITLEQEEPEQTDNSSPCQGLTSNTTQSCDETTIIIPYDDDSMEKHRKDSCSLHFDIDSHVHDVHDVSMGIKVGGNKTEQMPMNVNIPRACDSPTMGRLESRLERRRSSLDMTSGLPPIGGPRGKALPSDLRRNSMSAVDYERLKIDNEVGWLRERLRVVQEGRVKLNFSVGHKQREKIQLKLLEDISSQLREIRQLTEPGKAARQASLPHLFSKVKVMSKKRCWRSASLEL